jgi:STAS-like domain of unknown function (DUF4325)
MTVYVVAEEFTPDIGGRLYSDGDFSGEEFRETVLAKLVERAVEEGRELHINFDGVTGMPPSFLEEAFGGLFRHRPDLPVQKVLRLVKIEAPNSPKLWPYVRFAENAMRAEAHGK